MPSALYQEHYLYGGEVKIKFYPKSHMYKVTDEKNGVIDKRVKGVTTYLGIKDKSAPIQMWSLETMGIHLLDLIENGETITPEHIARGMVLPTEKKDEAGEIGKRAHEWCEYFIKHKLGREGYEAEPTLPEDQETLLGLQSFLEFYSQHDVEFLDSEKIVYSRKYGYIGIMDFKARVNGKLASGDLKTSNGLYNTVFAQTGAYSQADEEEMEFLGTPISYEASYAVRLAKETEDEYMNRMYKKNAVRALLGKDQKPIEQYKPFEWRMIEGREAIEHNFKEGFLNCMNLFLWDAATDFYKLDKANQDAE